MAFGSGAQLKVVDIVEVTFGTTPAAPAMTIKRVTGQTLELTRSSFRSNELTATRAANDLRLGAKKGQGDLLTEITYGDVDAWLESLLGGTWTAEGPGTPNTLKLGTTKRSRSIEVGHLDVGQFFMYKGVVFDKMALSAKPGSNPTLRWSVIAKDMGAPTQVTAANSTPAATTNSPMDAYNGTLKEGGVTSALITGLDINFDNQVDPADVINAGTIPDYFLKRLLITGTMTAYFQDVVLLNKFLNETESSIEATFNNAPAGTKTLAFKLPRIKYTRGAVPVNNDGGITMQLPFEAMYNAGDTSNVVITRSNP